MMLNQHGSRAHICPSMLLHTTIKEGLKCSHTSLKVTQELKTNKQKKQNNNTFFKIEKGSAHSTLSQELFVTCLSACITDAFEGCVETQGFVLAQADLLRNQDRKKKGSRCLVAIQKWHRKKFSMETTYNLSFSLYHSEMLSLCYSIISPYCRILQKKNGY